MRGKEDGREGVVSDTENIFQPDKNEKGEKRRL
jgi:hypothetical protein